MTFFFPVAFLKFINTVHSLGIGSVYDYGQLPTYPSLKLKSTAFTSYLKEKCGLEEG